MSAQAASDKPGNGEGRLPNLITGVQERNRELRELASGIGEQPDPDDVHDVSKACEVLEGLPPLATEVQQAIAQRTDSTSAAIRDLADPLKALSASANKARHILTRYKQVLGYEQQKRLFERQPDTNTWRSNQRYREDQDTLDELRDESAAKLNDLLGHLDGLLRQLRAL
jgi:Asp-tRNA(Asn)/Glu-tRNA(Gln) amidotransferase C subunit